MTGAGTKSDTDDKLVGAALTRSRKAAGLTQAELAESVGIKQPTLSKTEAGFRKLSFLEAMLVCKALGIGLDDLAGCVLEIASSTASE